MKKTNQPRKQRSDDHKKSRADEKKVNKSSVEDKDEKVRSHRTTDIQKPAVNKS